MRQNFQNTDFLEMPIFNFLGISDGCFSCLAYVQPKNNTPNKPPLQKPNLRTRTHARAYGDV